MNNEAGSIGSDVDEDDFDEFDQDDDLADTVVLPDADDDDDDDDTDNVGDASVEINVEELIADIESSNDPDCARKKEVRRRLEELAESKSLEDTYAIEFDDK